MASLPTNSSPAVAAGVSTAASLTTSDALNGSGADVSQVKWGVRPKRKDQRKADRLAAELQSLGEHTVAISTTTPPVARTPSVATANANVDVINKLADTKTGRVANKSSRRKERKFLQQKAAEAAARAAANGIISEVSITGAPINVATAADTVSSVGTTTTTTTTDATGVEHTVITSTVDDDNNDIDAEGDDKTNDSTSTNTSDTNGSADDANQGIYPLVRNKLPKSKADRRADSDHTLLTERFSSPEQKAAFEARVVEQGPAVSEFMKARLEREARKNWDMFYKRNTAKFFKDRHYIQREFSEIDEKNCVAVDTTDTPAERKRLVEVGCGCGNTLFPLIQDNPHLDFFGFDFAPRAVELLQERLDELKVSNERCGLSVCDIAKEPFPTEVVNYDFATIMFVLSALEPSTMPAVLEKTFAALKPGGIVYMRDYALYDMTQLRFKKGSKIGDNFYMRWDGTRSFFFTTEHLRDLFTAAGFEVTFLGYISKVVRNIKLETNMQRTWVQIKARKPLTAAASTATTSAPTSTV